MLYKNTINYSFKSLYLVLKQRLMRTIKSIFPIFIILILLGIFSCNKNMSSLPKVIDLYPSIGQYISEYTKQRIGSNEAFKIRFASAVVKESEIGTTFNGITINPSINGTAIWEDASTLIFTPKERYTNGKSYELQLALSKVYPDVAKELKNVAFDINILPLQASIQINEINYKNENGVVANVTGEINTTDWVDNVAIEKAVLPKINNNSTEIKWEHFSATSHKFSIVGINKQDKNQTLTIDYDLEAANLKGGKEIKIDSRNDFSVRSVRASSDQGKTIEIFFTDPLQPNQNLNGLITIDGASNNDQNLKFEISDNKVTAFISDDNKAEIKLRVDKNIKNYANSSMIKSHEATLSFDQGLPELRSLRSGNIFPFTDKVILPIEAKAISHIQVDILKIYQNNVLQFLQYNSYNYNYETDPVGEIISSQVINLADVSAEDNSKNFVRYAIDISKLVKLDLGSIYQIRVGFRKEDSKYPACGEKQQRVSEDSTDILTYGDSYEDYNYDEVNNPCHRSYYTTSRYIVQNILASNLGLIAKGSEDGEHLIIATDLVSGGPSSNVEIKLYSFQKQELNKGQTDKNGFSVIPTSKKPFYAVGISGGQYAYLAMSDPFVNDLTSFDIEGKEKRADIDGFIYGDRGVWRPGDDLYLSFILDDLKNTLPEDYPVRMIVTDARGKKKFDRLAQTHKGRIYAFTVPTDAEDVTGSWKVEVKIGNQSFTKNLKIENVKPNKLKLGFDPNIKRIEFANGNMVLPFSAEWLFGASASGLKAEAEITFNVVPTTFNGYKQYEFDDPSRKVEPNPINMGQLTLNEEGRTNFTLAKNADLVPPGFMNANIKTRVFEKSGDFSEDFSSYPVSIYNQYVGINFPKSQWGGNYITTGKTYKVPLIVLDAKGKPVPNSKLKVGLYTADWSWWYNQGYSNIFQYSSGQHIGAIETSEVTTNAKGEATWSKNFTHEGNFMIRVCDQESGHCTGTFFYSSEWGMPDDPKSPKNIAIQVDKENYNVGENVEVKIPSNKDSKILITIEKNQRVIDKFWVDGQELETKVKIPVSADMLPNAYIYATLLQSELSSAELPIRLYGVQNIKVSDKSTIITPKIDAPTKVEPEKSFEVNVSEADGKEMSYTIAIVDEGLLGLTSFKTPDPHGYFNSKEALTTKTWDIYDYVAGYMGNRFENIITIGGDQAMSGKNTAKANRFPPVVKFEGPFTLTKGEKRKHKFTINNYIGAVRAMVVARSNHAFGSAEKEIAVKSPIMVQATLPRTIGLNEDIYVASNVFVMDAAIKNANVTVKANDLFTKNNVVDSKLDFDGIGDKISFVKISSGQTEGIGKISVTAVSGKNNASKSTEVQVKNPNPALTVVKSDVIPLKGTKYLDFNLIGSSGSNSVLLEVSSVPAFNLSKHLNSLLRYPYGCLEQITSSAFPQLYLTDLTSLSKDQENEIPKAVASTIRKLTDYSMGSGAFSYWPRSNNYNDWSTSYAGHFLAEAKSKNYSVPTEMMAKWVKYQKERAKNWRVNTYNGWSSYESNLDQSYRLFTLALSGNPDLSAMNRLRSDKALTYTAAHLLAASYSIISQKEVAQSLIGGKKMDIATYKNDSPTYGSELRDLSLISLAHNYNGNKVEEAKVITDIAKILDSNRWFSTQEMAFGLCAMSKYVDKLDKKGLNYTYQVNGGNKITVNNGKAISLERLTINGNANQKVSVTNSTGGQIFVKVASSGKPIPNQSSQPKPDDVAENIALLIKYTDSNNSPIDVNNLKQGTNFKAFITIRDKVSTSRSRDNMALSYAVPSGWEISNTRSSSDITMNGKSQYDYIDFKDDRVNIFFRLLGSNTYVVNLTATYGGKFYLPITKCEAMYDGNTRASTGGSWINVLLPNAAPEVQAEGE